MLHCDYTKDLLIFLHFFTETPWLHPSYLVDETSVPQSPAVLQPIENTQELLQEFNNVYNAVHYTNLSHPTTIYGGNVNSFQSNTSFNPHYAYDTQQLPLPVVQHSANINNSYNNEIQFVDEILHAHCKDIKDQWLTELDCSSSSASSAYSYNFSPAGSDLESTYNGSTGSNDEDFEYFRGGRVKPYDREMMSDDNDNKHFRKKDQNKNAARKYRQKKKQEVEEILVEEKQLTEVHNKLAKECGEIRREVKYLKSLMRELFKSKGLID